jgi:hypothetical protein
MTCARCHRDVPADRIACDCYVLRADREQRSMALSRFLAGEAPLFLRRGHVYPDRRQRTAMCGQAVLTNRKDDWKGVRVLRADEIGDIGCEECRKRVVEEGGRE